MFKGIDRLNPSPSFKVETSGSDQIYQWLSSQLRISVGLPPINLSVPNDDKTILPLGSLTLQDNLLEGMLSAASHSQDDQEFEIKTLLKARGNTDLGELLQQALNSGRFNLNNRDGAISIDLDEISGQLSLKKVFTQLQRTLKELGFEAEYAERENDIRIFKPVQSDDGEIDRNLAFALHTLGPANGYCFHLNQPQEISESDFQKKFEEYGLLLGKIVDALYQSNGLASPSKRMVISPPKNIKDIIKRAEEADRIKKRMLARSGLLDPSVELAEVIESKILVDARPEVTFDQIGGLETVKQDLQLVIAGLTDPNIYFQRGTKPPRGIIFYGPSGTGKTLLAKALAHHSNAMFYNVELADILDSLLGKTEQLVAEVFEHANRNAPSIIFFDEIDALGSERNNLNSFYSNIVTILLTKLRGLKKRGDNVIVIAATNRRDQLDDSLLSPGRFDWQIKVGLPENARERKSIIRIHMEAAQTLAGDIQLFDPSLDIDKLAELSNQLSGAEIENLIMEVLRQKAKADYYGISSGLVTTDEIITLIQKAKRNRRSTLGFV